MRILYPSFPGSLRFTYLPIIVFLVGAVALKPILHLLGCNWAVSESFNLRNDREDCKGIKQVVFIHPSREKNYLSPASSFKVILVLFASPFSVKDKTYGRRNKPTTFGQSLVNLKSDY